MTNKLPGAAEDVARLLYLLEQNIDDAFANAGRLSSAIAEARREERLSAIVGQPVFAYTAQALATLSDARGHIVKTHQHLDRVAGREGITVRAWGEEKPKPTGGFLATSGADCEAVEA